MFTYCSCDTKTSFIYLDLHTMKITKESSQYNYEPKGDKLYESILIKNPPLNEDTLKAIMVYYFDSLIRKEQKNASYAERQMSFYRYSSRTEPFM